MIHSFRIRILLHWLEKGAKDPRGQGFKGENLPAVPEADNPLVWVMHMDSAILSIRGVVKVEQSRLEIIRRNDNIDVHP